MTASLRTVKQIAELLRIRQHGVLALIHSGDLRAVDVSLRPGGRPRWRIAQGDLDDFLQRRTRQPDPPRRRRRKRDTTVTQYF